MLLRKFVNTHSKKGEGDEEKKRRIEGSAKSDGR